MTWVVIYNMGQGCVVRMRANMLMLLFSFKEIDCLGWDSTELEVGCTEREGSRDTVKSSIVEGLWYISD